MSPSLRPSPAVLASGFLHLGVLAALLFVRPPPGEPAGEGPPVTVRLATSGDLAAAEAAAAGPPAEAAPPETPTSETAPDPTPQPEPLPAPAPPVPAPRSAPAPVPAPKPAPRPAPTPAPSPPKPVPPTPAKAPAAAKPSPRTPERVAANPPAKATPAAPRASGGGLDLDALASQVSRLGGNRPGPPAPSGGARSGPSAAALAGLQDRLQELWNPNCGVEGGRDVRVRVSFGLAPGGDLAGPVEAGGLERSDNPVVRAAAERAIRAVHQAAPFPALASPAGQRIAVNFNAREACS